MFASKTDARTSEHPYMKNLTWELIDIEERERDFFFNLEREWQRSIHRLSEGGWLRIFPEAREILPSKIKEWKTERTHLVDVAKRAIHRKTPENAIETRLSLQLLVVPRINEAEQHLTRLKHLVVYRPHVNGHAKSRITDADIQQAKAVPIASLLSSKIRRTGKTSTTNCPLHDDRSPSFVIYHDTNSCWCFGCQQGGDSIALVRKLSNMSFIEAVKYLNRI